VPHMRRPVRRVSRPRIRAELDATAVPTWRPRSIATDAASLHFVLSPGRLPRGRRIYAIGDIHGCLAELHQLHAAIADDIARRPTGSVLLLHLGDYIDFGPDSAGVLTLLAADASIAGVPIMASIAQWRLDVRIMKCFPISHDDGRKCIVVPLMEKRCAPTRTPGTVTEPLRGFAGKYARGRHRPGLWEAYSSSLRTSLTARRWKSRSQV